MAEQPSRDYAFAVKRDSESSTGTVALIVGGVEVPDVLIDSGATCNLMGRGTWEWLKKHGVKCESKKQMAKSHYQQWEHLQLKLNHWTAM